MENVIKLVVCPVQSLHWIIIFCGIIVVVVGILFIIYRRKALKVKLLNDTAIWVKQNKNQEALVKSEMWAVGFFIDIVDDILPWINVNREQLQQNGINEVSVIDGDALADFIRRKCGEGKYGDISLYQLDSMHNSVVIVAIKGDGQIVDDQMIRSKGGLSDDARKQFNGQPTMRIKI